MATNPNIGSFGVKYARIAVLDSDEKVNTTAFGSYTNGVTNGIFKADEKTARGITVGNITGLAPNSSDVYGSNIKISTIRNGVGTPSATLTFNDFPMEVLHVLNGYTVDEKGIASLGADNKAPYCAVELVSTDWDGNDLHFALLKGLFSPVEHDLQTDNESKQQATVSFTFTGSSRLSDRKAYGEVSSGDPKFDQKSWDDFVFPTATPGAGSSH
jgi:phi13 family phage major tail protein